MIFFIICLRALAACLITNAHYTDIYPVEIIANGGLLGDVIFFAVSGYCLCNIKMPFPKWYSKRVLRCYVPVILTTAVYMILGEYSLDSHSVVWWYVYPTYYHFVASIVVLYIPFYFVLRIKILRDRIPLIMGALAVVQLVIYLLFYDRSTYHIDTVREPMIRILFFECMLLGSYFRINDDRFRDKFSRLSLLGTIGSAGVYFVSKLLFSKGVISSHYQILNQYCLFCFLLCVFRLFIGMDLLLEKIPEKMKFLITYLSKITLEIYVVQYVIIDWVRPIGRFPLNWLLITLSILLAATGLHYLCEYIYGWVSPSKSKN